MCVSSSCFSVLVRCAGRRCAKSTGCRRRARCCQREPTTAVCNSAAAQRLPARCCNHSHQPSVDALVPLPVYCFCQEYCVWLNCVTCAARTWAIPPCAKPAALCTPSCFTLWPVCRSCWRWLCEAPMGRGSQCWMSSRAPSLVRTGGQLAAQPVLRSSRYTCAGLVCCSGCVSAQQCWMQRLLESSTLAMLAVSMP